MHSSAPRAGKLHNHGIFSRWFSTKSVYLISWAESSLPVSNTRCFYSVGRSQFLYPGVYSTAGGYCAFLDCLVSRWYGGFQLLEIYAPLDRRGL